MKRFKLFWQVILRTGQGRPDKLNDAGYNLWYSPTHRPLFHVGSFQGRMWRNEHVTGDMSGTISGEMLIVLDFFFNGNQEQYERFLFEPAVQNLCLLLLVVRPERQVHKHCRCVCDARGFAVFCSGKPIFAKNAAEYTCAPERESHHEHQI